MDESEILEVIRACDLEVERLQQRWPHGVSFESRTDAPVYKAYPHYFLSAFPDLNEYDVRRLSIALRMMADAVRLTDVIIDEVPATGLVSREMSHQALQFEAYHILYGLFQPQAAFWERFRTYFAQYARACILESVIKAQGGMQLYDYSDILAIALGKAALAKSVAAGLVELAGDDSLLDPLSQSIDHLQLAVQLCDDVHDWRRDLRLGLPSTFLQPVLAELAERGIKIAADADADWLAKYLYYGGHVEAALERALQEFDKALSAVETLPLPAWRERILRGRRSCEELRSDITRLTKENVLRARARSVDSLIPGIGTSLKRA